MVVTENAPDSAHLTLFLKCSRVTILLLVDPLSPMPALKTELLKTLQERYPSGLPVSPLSPSAERIPIPDSISKIALAMPIDSHDTSKGWKEINSSSTRVGKGGVKVCPKSLGIKDAGVLAFRFRGGDEDEAEEGEDEEEEVERKGEKFVVEWPSYDDEVYEQPMRENSMDKN